MTAQSIVCGACAAEVPYGRLSCPSCGELLASVAGSRRATAPVAASIAASKAVPKVLYDPDAAPSASVVDGQVSLQASDGADEDDELPAWTPQSATVPWGTASDLNGGRTPAYMPRPGRRLPATPPVATPSADPLPADPEPAWPSDRAEPLSASDDEGWLLTDPTPAATVQPEPAAVGEPAPEVARPEREPLPEPDIDTLFPPVPAARYEAEPPRAPAPAVSLPEPGSTTWQAREPVAWPEPGVTVAPPATSASTP